MFSFGYFAFYSITRLLDYSITRFLAYHYRVANQGVFQPKRVSEYGTQFAHRIRYSSLLFETLVPLNHAL